MRDSDKPQQRKLASWPVRNRLVGVFDVLGFRSMLSDEGLPSLMRRTAELKRTLDGMFRWEARTVTFSDTILVYSAGWRGLLDEVLMDIHVDAFLRYCSYLMAEGVLLGLPLRAGIAFGPCAVVPTRGVFVGQPIVDAHDVEQAQDWIGVALHHSCWKPVPHPLRSVAVRYEIPCKKPFAAGSPPLEWTLDWPRLFGGAALGEELHALVRANEGTPYHERWLRTWEYYRHRRRARG